ncbi:hypothetical protein Tco_0173530 [Tanacetum coccineum]
MYVVPRSWIKDIIRSFSKRNATHHEWPGNDGLVSEGFHNEEIKLSVEEPLSTRLRGDEDQLSAKHQLAVKGLFECKALESNMTYSSQRHSQGSRRLLEYILVSWDGYQLACRRNMLSDSDVEEDNRTSNEFLADLNVEYQESALLANQKRFYKRIDDPTKSKNEKGKSDKGKSDKGLIAESFNWDDDSVSSEDEGTTTFKAFMAIAKDEPSVGKGDARSCQ